MTSREPYIIRKLRKILRRIKSYQRLFLKPEHYEPQQDFSTCASGVRAICFHLPQFHRTPENDLWWGEGFTEWTNARAAQPQYQGHYQPRVPHADIGEYDLTDLAALKKQADLAKAHGLAGFCYYYYHFNGNRPLERPLKLLLENPELDLAYCLCWANGHWVRSWSGQHHEFLIQQNHHPDDDIHFIEGIADYLQDPRYIRVQGKPLILVFETKLIPDPAATAARWRTWCRQNGIGEICLAGVAEAGNFFDPRGIGYDKIVEFPPHPIAEYRRLRAPKRSGFRGSIYNYEALVEAVCNRQTKADAYDPGSCIRGTMLKWDNTARRGADAHIWERFSHELYYRWLSHLVGEVQKYQDADERMIFINAWNEWAEGTYLEPDAAYGYKSLNTTSKALFGLPY